jgi:SAM-dependent methyltransferase
MRAKSDVIAEYDGLYQRRPNIWTNPDRDEFAFKTIATYVHSKPPATMLDIGCGSGHTLGYFHERWPGTLYTGLDLSVVALKMARRRQPYAKFINGWLGEVKLGRYELVVLLGVAEHLENLQAELAAARETMAISGLMYIEVPNCISYPTSQPQEGFRAINQGNCQHEWHLRRDTWENILCQVGFEILVSKVGPTVTSEFVWLLGRAKDIKQDHKDGQDIQDVGRDLVGKHA